MFLHTSILYLQLSTHSDPFIARSTCADADCPIEAVWLRVAVSEQNLNLRLQHLINAIYRVLVDEVGQQIGNFS